MQLADHRKQKTMLECAVHPRVPGHGNRKQSIYKLGMQYCFSFKSRQSCAVTLNAQHQDLYAIDQDFTIPYHIKVHYSEKD